MNRLKEITFEPTKAFTYLFNKGEVDTFDKNSEAFIRFINRRSNIPVDVFILEWDKFIAEGLDKINIFRSFENDMNIESSKIMKELDDDFDTILKKEHDNRPITKKSLRQNDVTNKESLGRLSIENEKETDFKRLDNLFERLNMIRDKIIEERVIEKDLDERIKMILDKIKEERKIEKDLEERRFNAKTRLEYLDTQEDYIRNKDRINALISEAIKLNEYIDSIRSRSINMGKLTQLTNPQKINRRLETSNTITAKQLETDREIYKELERLLSVDEDKRDEEKIRKLSSKLKRPIDLIKRIKK